MKKEYFSENDLNDLFSKLYSEEGTRLEDGEAEAKRDNDKALNKSGGSTASEKPTKTDGEGKVLKKPEKHKSPEDKNNKEDYKKSIPISKILEDLVSNYLKDEYNETEVTTTINPKKGTLAATKSGTEKEFDKKRTNGKRVEGYVTEDYKETINRMMVDTIENLIEDMSSNVGGDERKSAEMIISYLKDKYKV